MDYDGGVADVEDDWVTDFVEAGDNVVVDNVVELCAVAYMFTNGVRMRLAAARASEAGVPKAAQAEEQ